MQAIHASRYASALSIQLATIVWRIRTSSAPRDFQQHHGGILLEVPLSLCCLKVREACLQAQLCIELAEQLASLQAQLESLPCS